MYNRFFSFGCSWTNWFWPTWADIIAKDLSIEHQNWGSWGSGNQAIQSRFVEAKNQHNISSNDLVIVQWSGWNREDRYIDGWKSGGNIFNNTFYDKKFVRKYWSLDNDLIKNSVILQTTNDAYSKLINYQFSFDFPFDIINEENNNYDLANKNNVTDTTLSLIRTYYRNIPEIDVPKINNSRFKMNCMDTHPDVLSHIDIVEKYIYPKLFEKRTIKDETREFFYNYYDDMSAILSLKDSWNDMHRKAYKINAKYNYSHLGELRGV